MAQRTAGRSAVTVLLVGTAGLAVWAGTAPRTDLSVHLQSGWSAAAALVPALATLALLVWRLPGHGVTRVLLVSVLANIAMLASAVVAEHGTGAASTDDVLGRISDAAWAGTVPLLPVLILLFPTGRPPSPRWRRVLHAQLLAVLSLFVVALVLPPPDEDGTGVVAVVAVVCLVVLLTTGVAATVRLAASWRRLPDDERARGRLFVVLAGLLAASYLASPLLAFAPEVQSAADDLAYPILTGGLPTAIGLSVLRHRLFGLEVVLHRTLLAVSAGTVLLGAYLLAALGVAAVGGPTLGRPGSAIVPALLVVVVLAPVTALARRLVDRLLYGDRSQPQRALRRLGDALASTVASDQVPALVSQTLVDSLRVPWARVDLDDEGTVRPFAQAGVRGSGSLVSVPLVRTGEPFGALLVEVRQGQSQLSTGDLALLSALAGQAAVALEAVQLTEQLLQSRERLVLGREEERARLRNDLHDDLTPALAGMVLALDAGRRLLRSDSAAGEALLERVASEARSCGDVVRRLLADLRPPGLAEMGLLAAVEDSAARLHRPGDFEVRVDAPGPLPPVSEAVEVAAYRIVGEALSNAARHAGARQCTLHLRDDAGLVVEVRDDGRGMSGAAGATVNGSGLGIPSMRQRARDVGGTLELSSVPGGGTAVIARLPVLPVQKPA